MYECRDDNKIRIDLKSENSPYLKPKWVVKMGFKWVWGWY